MFNSMSLSLSILPSCSQLQQRQQKHQPSTITDCKFPVSPFGCRVIHVSVDGNGCTVWYKWPHIDSGIHENAQILTPNVKLLLIALTSNHFTV